MPSPHHWRLVSVVSLLVFVAIACTDGLTSPVAPPVQQVAAPLPSLTIGSGTMTLVGRELLLPNGRRIPIDSATAGNFRYLAVSLPKTQELAKRMAPVWAKAGLPEPTSPLQARLAIAAYKGFSSVPSELRGLLTDVPDTRDALPETPISTKPTLVADCDPVFTFCGFDTGEDPTASGGGGGGTGVDGSNAGSSLCISLFTQLNYATANWRQALASLADASARWSQCVSNHVFDWQSACAVETVQLASAITNLAIADSLMQACALSLRAFNCI